MNCLAIAQRGDVLLVDCGVTFDRRPFGVDVVHPDFAVLDDLLERLDGGRARVVGVAITHGHEDHIGAVPYLLRRFDVAVWGPRYALALLRERAQEHGLVDRLRLVETKPGLRYAIESFVVEPLHVTHSIVDATSLAITTDIGTVVHTGDFKFDETPLDGAKTDVARFAELGAAGVALLFSDSTNIDAAGATGSEADVAEVLRTLVEGATGAAFVALFASNVHRLRALGEVAARTGRKIVTLGRSVVTHSREARAQGLLDWSSDLVVAPDRAVGLPRNKILALASGTQAEPRAALARLAKGDHPYLEVCGGDTVILSSRVIPGHEPDVHAMLCDLLRRGAFVHSWTTDRGVHVSGHAQRDEQRRMIELLRPAAFVPVHGTLHHLRRHAALAIELGVADVRVLENGDLVEFAEHGSRTLGRLPVSRVHTQAGRALAPSALKERMGMAAEGLLSLCVLATARGDARDVSLITRGVLDESRDEKVLDALRREVRAAIAELPRDARSDAALAEVARLAARRTMIRALGFKPVVVVHVHRLP